jgi:hypothetical protein
METNLKEQIKKYIHMLNEGSDNSEYLRGQVELAMNLLGYDSDNEDSLRNELESFAKAKIEMAYVSDPLDTSKSFWIVVDANGVETQFADYPSAEEYHAALLSEL